MTFTIRECEDSSISANGSTTLKIDIAQGVTFTVSKIIYKSTGNFKITRIYDSAAKQDFLVGSLHETHFDDGNGKTLVINPPIVLKGSTSLKFDVTDTSGSSNAVYLAVIGDEK